MSITKNEMLPKSQQAQDKAATFQKFLIFMIRDTETSDLKLGVDVAYVVDILDSYELTYLPMVPEYVRGVFNLRGIFCIYNGNDDFKRRNGTRPNNSVSVIILFNRRRHCPPDADTVATHLKKFFFAVFVKESCI